ELSSVEELEENLSKALQTIEEEQMGVAIQLNQVRASLQKVAAISDRFEQFSSRIESLRIELEDLTAELSNALEAVEANPARLEILNGQLQLLNDLLKKHHAQSIQELIERRDQLEQKVIQTESAEGNLQSHVENQKKMITQLDKLSLKLSNNRKKAIPIFTEQMEKILALLGMPDARFQLELIPIDTYLSHGKEKLNFAFSANQGSDFGTLKKVASGGELSRIMLSIKAILSQFKTLPTIIFDEIDTGVSGEVAYKIADIMDHMGKYMQVITITHLPQVAAKGAHHFKVFKETRDGSTFTQLKKLLPQERIEEVAQMLAGDDLSDTALQHAKELLN
ncbi:DNA repair protein RecN, partial [Flavobacteriaceae bacterium]|nr:DNA repair protein RecN [Flavobacteriaceae bacterium]